MSSKRVFSSNYISLFCGCGGFDTGFKENGFSCVGAYDIDVSVIDVYKRNLETKVHLHDLTCHELPGNIPQDIDVIVAGSPCQGFSTLGKRKLNDPRNELLLTGGLLAIKYKAKVFVCENVLGSLSGKHKMYWNKLLRLLKNAGYRTKLVTYDASDLGIPQTRKRIILYSWKSDNLIDLEIKQPIFRKKKLSEVLSDLIDVENHNLDYIDIDSKEHIIASHINQGQKLSNVRGGERSIHTWDIPEVFGQVDDDEKAILNRIMKLRRQIRRRKNGDADPVEIKLLYDNIKLEKNKFYSIIESLTAKGYIKKINSKFLDLTHTFNGKFKRLSLIGLSPTVDTRFGSYKHFLHPFENRAFSVREAARIQGFKDDFIFTGNIKKQYQMIGNAVPPPLSFEIAKNVKELIIPNL